MAERVVHVPGSKALGDFEIELVEKGSGAPLLFLHGLDGLEWNAYLDELVQTYHVYAPLGPGYGDSTGTESLHDFHDLLYVYMDLLDVLGLRNLPLVGHSLGGMIAAELAAFQPERFTRLVLIAPLGLWNPAHPVLDLFTVRPAELAQAMYADPEHAKLRGPVSIVEAPTPDQFVEFQMDRSKALTQAARWMWPIPDRGLNRRIHRVTQPTLLVWGEQDGIVPPAYAKDWQALLKDARAETVPCAAHMITYDQPQQLAEITKKFIG